ncbi:MAG: sugar phosphate isomerase/epimerase family protein, partial [Planctomycetota bacterium]
MEKVHQADTRSLSRRDMLRRAAAGTAIIGVPGFQSRSRAQTHATTGRLRQSIAFWCFEKYWDLAETCRVAQQLGCKSVELIEPKHWPMLKQHGLVCALAGSHWFDKGMNNPKYQEECLSKMRQAIDDCAEFGFPNVITFTGLAEGISPDEGARNCVTGYKKIIGYAEKKKVNI